MLLMLLASHASTQTHIPGIVWGVLGFIVSLGIVTVVWRANVRPGSGRHETPRTDKDDKRSGWGR